MSAFTFVVLMLSVASAQALAASLILVPNGGKCPSGYKRNGCGGSGCFCEEIPPPIRVPVPGPSCICNRKYDPVCGRDGVTYSNACMARCTGAGVRCQGQCPCRRPPPVPAGCFCTAEFAPVCGSDGTTYSNPCEAGCKHATVECEGGCPCRKPSPPPPTPTDINAFLDECVKKGELASVAAARAACSEVILKCPLAAPQLEAVGSAAAFSSPAEPSLPDALLEAVLQGTCLVEAEVACRSSAFGNISDSDCQSLLDFGPVNVLGGSECSTLQDANNIFNEEVNRLCKRK